MSAALGFADDEEAAPASGAKAEPAGRVSLDVARERAKTMQDIYTATLEVMHHRYFHGARATVPARAMEDIFDEIKRQSKVEARWISANTKPMSIDHEPKTDFEKRAAKEIGDGTPDLEVIEDGYYRRASAIPLAGGCISCHEGFFNTKSKKPRFAGLVISVPIESDSASSE